MGCGFRNAITVRILLLYVYFGAFKANHVRKSYNVFKCKAYLTTYVCRFVAENQRVIKNPHGETW